MKEIYIYNDSGSSQFCVNQLSQCLSQIFKENNVSIEYITGKEILNGKLFHEKSRLENVLLCLGGGYDLGYLESLKKEMGCNEIERFVRLGGNYLGLCAGAYFAADSIEFDLNGPLEVKGDRFLKFFQGKAIGPINQPYIYSSDEENLHANSLSAKIKLKYEKQSYFTYLNGGCYFDAKTQAENLEVLAEYEDFSKANAFLEKIKGRAAIVKVSYGLGACLLSGVHFEFEPRDLKFIDEDIYISLMENYKNQNSSHCNYKLIASLFEKSFGKFSLA